MITFSVKVDDHLHEQLQRQLRATGKTRSAFVRELIERELQQTSERYGEMRRKLMRFAGSAAGNSAPGEVPSDVSQNVKKYLDEWGYGLDRDQQPR